MLACVVLILWLSNVKNLDHGELFAYVQLMDVLKHILPLKNESNFQHSSVYQLNNHIQEFVQVNPHCAGVSLTTAVMYVL